MLKTKRGNKEDSNTLISNLIKSAKKQKLKVFTDKEEAKEFAKEKKAKIAELIYSQLDYYIVYEKYKDKNLFLLAITHSSHTSNEEQTNSVAIYNGYIYLINIAWEIDSLSFKKPKDVTNQDVYNSDAVHAHFLGKSFSTIEITPKELRQYVKGINWLLVLVGVAIIGVGGYFLTNKVILQKDKIPPKPFASGLSVDEKFALQKIISSKAIDYIEGLKDEALGDKVVKRYINITLSKYKKLRKREYSWNPATKKWEAENPSLPERGGYSTKIDYTIQTVYPEIGYSLEIQKGGRAIYRKAFTKEFKVDDGNLGKIKRKKMTMGCFSKLYFAPFLTSSSDEEKEKYAIVTRDNNYIYLNYSKLSPKGLFYWIKPILKECPVVITKIRQNSEKGWFNLNLKAKIERDKRGNDKKKRDKSKH